MLYRIARPVLFALEAERAHRLAIRALAMRGGGPVTGLPISVAGLDFCNPLGLAAGLDKDGEATRGLFGLGFGSVEIGTLTPRAQSGNPRPRLFRLVEDEGVINRMGFNNGGLAAALARVKGAPRTGVLGINVGANKDSADRVADYRGAVADAAPHADYVTINVSSPNTPGLRDLQHGAALDELLAACRESAGATPLFLKIAPDLDATAIDGVARAAIERRIDALIVGNTTITRPALRSGAATETGGLSGAPLRPLALQRLKDARAATGGALPLIAVGGVASGADAYARIRAGASLVQLYTALVFEGPGLPKRILRDLAVLIGRNGFASVAEAIGAG